MYYIQYFVKGKINQFIIYFKWQTNFVIIKIKYILNKIKYILNKIWEPHH